MKNISCFFALFISISLHASVEMTRVNPELFIHQPQTDLAAITKNDDALKEKWVRSLFDRDILNHEGTKAFSVTADFNAYYADFKERFRLIDLNNDGTPELVFDGFVSKDDEKEHVEIFCSVKGELTRIYDEIGHILAYKIHPNTQEILLYHHQYPCCLNASHNLNRLRLVEGKLQAVKRYFLGREAGDMKGTFFPKKTRFTSKLKETKKEVQLRWSGSVITKNAWTRRVQSNVIAPYKKGSLYKVLAEEKQWLFVRMQTPPEIGENKVVNPNNLQETAVYGWLEKRKL
ncbi:MAG: hypothetical protein QE487_11480 [Fluviicola sp.]|nr:hypothetical protein [Fluviicola sp.]